MPVSCPKCGSRFINLAKVRSGKERLKTMFGISPLRCGDCRTRFIGDTFMWRDLLFARCPRCYRMDLNLWRDEHMRTSGWMALMLAAGGRRLRCEYCRVNFVSLRRRKEHFTFNRWERQQAAASTSQK